MKWLFFSSFLLLTSTPAKAQHLKLFRSVIYTAHGERLDGILYDMTDSTIRYVPNKSDVIYQLQAGQTPAIADIHWSMITKIVVRRKGHVGRGMLIGTSAGLIYSLGIAVFTHPDHGKGIGALPDVVRATVIVTAPIGGFCYGALSSLIPYRVKRIRQNREAYKDAKSTWKWRSVAAQRRVYLSNFPADTLPRQYP